VAARGQPVAFFSLEMSAEELVDRFSVRRAGRDGIGNDRRANVAIASQIEAVGKLKALHIYEAEDAGTIAQIEANCRLLAASPSGLGAVVVDYLQLVTPPADTKREVREQQVAAMSRRFKLLARAIGCPVFLCAQLNRESEKDERRPRLSDLRESGAIEQDADRVWFLYRPKIAPNQLPASEDAAEIDVALYQAKCRNGPGGIEAVLRFNRPTFNFIPA
jgi:replicative DNA helicase